MFALLDLGLVGCHNGQLVRDRVGFFIPRSLCRHAGDSTRGTRSESDHLQSPTTAVLRSVEDPRLVVERSAIARDDSLVPTYKFPTKPNAAIAFQGSYAMTRSWLGSSGALQSRSPLQLGCEGVRSPEMPPVGDRTGSWFVVVQRASE